MGGLVRVNVGDHSCLQRCFARTRDNTTSASGLNHGPAATRGTFPFARCPNYFPHLNSQAWIDGHARGERLSRSKWPLRAAYAYFRSDKPTYAYPDYHSARRKDPFLIEPGRKLGDLSSRSKHRRRKRALHQDLQRRGYYLASLRAGHRIGGRKLEQQSCQ